ncbi:CBS domain-containing protein [Dongia sp. agr-C8]
MKAADIMTRSVVTIRDDATVRDAARLMLQDNLSGLPVVDRDDRLVGMVTEGDLLRRVEIGTEARRPKWLEFLVGPDVLAGEYVRSHARRISEIMTTPVVTIGEDAELEDVVRLMERKRIKRVVILRDGRIAGLITRNNMLQALAALIPDSLPTQASDRAIREGILAEMGRLHWRPSTSINPIVHDGVVELHGVILGDREADALCVLCENIPGVKRVNDRLVWVDPFSGLTVDRSDFRSAGKPAA